VFLTGKLGSTGLFGWLSGTSPADHFAISESEFKAAFCREKALAGRSLRSFSVAIFRPADQQNPRTTELLPILEERLRRYDTVGRMDSGQLAALLPETDEHGTAAVTDAILSQAAEIGVEFSCQIRSYPAAARDVDRESDSPPPGEGRPDDSDASRESARTGSASGGGAGVQQQQVAIKARPETAASLMAVAEEIAPPNAEEARHEEAIQSVAASTKRAFARDFESLDDRRVAPFRRLFDILVSGSALILLAPLLVTVGLIVKLTSHGPVIFKQRRAGQNGRPFWFYKFRSMKVDAEKFKAELADSNEKDSPIFKIKNDPRMTPVGRFLRRASIDELPQLWNVLRGDMTLVGPRPPTLDEVEHYEPWQHERLSVKGGLTCVWQVSGRSEIGFEEWVRMDLRYAQRRSTAMDLGLLLRTAKAIVSGRGAY
jgi:lipopolysaccharide/colanic/teichoic acid biosynthesis glycosyltransferase